MCGNWDWYIKKKTVCFLFFKSKIKKREYSEQESALSTESSERPGTWNFKDCRGLGQL